MEPTYKIFATSVSRQLGEKIAANLNSKLGNLFTDKFSDGEVFVRFEESIRGNIIFFVAQINMPYENLFELYLAVDAAKRASAKEIICVAPYMPHSRQERRNGERVAIAARMVADFMQQAGANRIITLDLHSELIEGFYNIPVDNLDASYIFASHIKSLGIEDLCLCSPDFGGVKRIKKYKKLLDCEMAVINKERMMPNQVSNMEIIGSVKDKNVVIIDDMIDTAGTLCKAAELIMEEGAKSVLAYATHGLFTSTAIERIEKSPLKRIVVTDSLNVDINSNKIAIISCADILSMAMERILSNKSFKEMYEEIR